jgi:hypothetical protein
MPPIPEVERLATTLDVSPEFLAFGRQGADALRGNKPSVFMVPEMSMGGKRLFQSGRGGAAEALLRKPKAQPGADPHVRSRS